MNFKIRIGFTLDLSSVDIGYTDKASTRSVWSLIGSSSQPKKPSASLFRHMPQDIHAVMVGSYHVVRPTYRMSLDQPALWTIL